MQTWEEMLITKILTQAVEDAKYTGLSKKYLKHKIEAINWIMTNDPQFKYYCKLLSIEPSYIRNKIKTHGDTKITAKQKVLLKPIVEKLLKSKAYSQVPIQQISSMKEKLLNQIADRNCF